MALSAVVTFYLESIRQAWEFVLESGAGIGLVLMLRWYWWRVNAWSEVSALVAAAVGFALVRLLTDWVFPLSLVAVVAWTTVWWLAVTWLTPPEAGSHARRVLHAGPPAGTRLGTDGARGSAARQRRSAPLVGAWLAGTALVYAVLFGVGHLLLHSAHRGPALLRRSPSCAGGGCGRALPRREDPPVDAPSVEPPSVALLRRRAEGRAAACRRAAADTPALNGEPPPGRGRLRGLSESAAAERVRRAGVAAEGIRRAVPGARPGLGAGARRRAAEGIAARRAAPAPPPPERAWRPVRPAARGRASRIQRPAADRAAGPCPASRPGR